MPFLSTLRPGKTPYGCVALGIPKRRWSSISIDYIAQLSPSINGNKSTMVVLYMFSKMIHAIPGQTSDAAEMCAEMFVDTV